MDLNKYKLDVAKINKVAEKCTKSELNNYLCGTELTADYFTPVEDLD